MRLRNRPNVRKNRRSERLFFLMKGCSIVCLKASGKQQDISKKLPQTTTHGLRVLKTSLRRWNVMFSRRQKDNHKCYCSNLTHFFMLWTNPMKESCCKHITPSNSMYIQTCKCKYKPTILYQRSVHHQVKVHKFYNP